MRASYLMFPHLKLELCHEFQLQQTLQDSMLTHIMELHDRCFHMNYSMISSGICYGISWPMFPRLTIQWLAHRQMSRDFVTAVSSPHDRIVAWFLQDFVSFPIDVCWISWHVAMRKHRARNPITFDHTSHIWSTSRRSRIIQPAGIIKCYAFFWPIHALKKVIFKNEFKILRKYF